MSTYTCYECRGVFSGRGLFPRSGTSSTYTINPHCPGCTLVLEQRSINQQSTYHNDDYDPKWIDKRFTNTFY